MCSYISYSAITCSAMSTAENFIPDLQRRASVIPLAYNCVVCSRWFIDSLAFKEIPCCGTMPAEFGVGSRELEIQRDRGAGIRHIVALVSG